VIDLRMNTSLTRLADLILPKLESLRLERAEGAENFGKGRGEGCSCRAPTGADQSHEEI